MSEPSIEMVVGLGNPGARYEGTRHNVGFAILERFASREGCPGFGPERRWKCEVTRIAGRGPVLVKPMTFMNLSGESVAAASRYHKIDPVNILVVSDDVALPFGRLRFRASGSAGGHNGLRSVIGHLGTDRFPRLRFGVATPEADPRVDLADHVLGRFTPSEQAALENCLDRAVDALRYAVANGAEAAMNAFNRAPDPGPPQGDTGQPPQGSPGGRPAGGSPAGQGSASGASDHPPQPT